MFLRRGFALLLVVAGCGAPWPAAGPLASHVIASAERHGVPADLMLAIAAAEGGLLLPKLRVVRADDEVPVAGVLELRHGRFDSLRRGAELMGTSELALRADTDLGTEAGARVLAELLRRSGSIRAALEELSGLGEERQRIGYAAEVLGILQSGGVFPARDGEQVVIAPHPEVAVPEPESFRQAASGPPDFPGAIWLTTSCTGKCDENRPDGNDAVDMILVHDTEGGWNASVATLQYDAGKSVHYIIDADGSRVGQFIPETYTGWHAGNYFYNKRSVGIEHVGYAANKAGYDAKLYQKSAELVASIRSRFTVPLDRAHVVGHYQVPDGTRIPQDSPPCALALEDCTGHPDYGGASNHTDPGIYWTWDAYMLLLGAKRMDHSELPPGVQPEAPEMPPSETGGDARGGCSTGGRAPGGAWLVFSLVAIAGLRRARQA
jgi:N-acetyl-anhydromuramyl-L-alanine amidase AmpD